MAEYSREDSAYAEQILGRLIEGEARDLELEPGLAVADLEQDARQFSDEMELLDDFDAPCPAMRIDGERVPVSLLLAFRANSGWFPGFPPGFGKSRYRRMTPDLYYGMDEYFRYWSQGNGSDEYPVMEREEARGAFARRAIHFLSTRVAAVRNWRNHEGHQPWPGISILSFRPSLKAAPAPGCNFTVSTNSSGLRVFWSGAYYVSPNNFNSPTTPTSSVLQSGTYIFGIDGGAYGNTIHWDQNLVVSLPGNPYAHLNY